MGTLAGGLGCSPFAYEVYPPQTDSQGKRNGLRSFPEVGNLVGPLVQEVLYGHHAIYLSDLATCLAQDDLRLGSLSLPRPPIGRNGRDVVREYQPVGHRLRLSASP